MNGLSYFSNDPANATNHTISVVTSKNEKQEYSADTLIAELNKCNLIDVNTTIYTSLIEAINDTVDLKTNHYNKLELLLKSYLNKMNSSHDVSLSFRDEKCVQSLLFGFYFIFNEQFSEFYEKNSKLRQILAEKNDDQTLQSFIKSYAYTSVGSNSSEQLAKQKHSLKTLDQIFKHYQKTNMKASYFNSSIKLCDSQPPILCI